jgi:hypothetical protein
MLCVYTHVWLTCSTWVRSGNMPKIQGTLEVNGEQAYCGQSVQLLARATLQENILFGLPADYEMYQRAMECTHCKEYVADMLPNGICPSLSLLMRMHTGGKAARRRDMLSGLRKIECVCVCMCVCELLAGDQTLLGDDGVHRSTVYGTVDAVVTLSQAQLVLVALARAVYKDAAVYLLDGEWGRSRRVRCVVADIHTHTHSHTYVHTYLWLHASSWA